MITIVTCDDHRIVAAGIRRILAETTDLVLQASVLTAADLLTAVKELRPAVAVVDIDLPDGNGLELPGRIREASPTTKTVIFSMYSGRAYVQKARANGASAYLTKACLDEELTATIRAVAHNDGFVSSSQQAGEVPADAPIKSLDVLSARELEVLKLLSQGLTNSEIATSLFVSPRTVEGHRASIQRKLGLRTRAELARAAHAAGIGA
jgi:DNA-binding NarL/FixJ family response regulator